MAAVTGVFNADFSSFFDAVQKSELHLKELEGDAAKVEKGLSRMADSFSGRKIIQEAAQMAEIFERAGGASAFTAKELERMGATGAEAVAKLKALGKEVPEGIQKIADESQSAEKATEGWASSLKTLAAGYLSLQGLQQVWGFAKEIMADADALEDLSAQTRLSTTELQDLGSVMQGFGVDMDEMGRALFGLSKRIGSGDDSVNDALLQMGLSIEKVKNLQPVEMLLTITDAAGRMNEQFRDSSLATLFGDKIGMAMSGAAGKIREAYDEQVKLNNAIGPEAVKNLADANREMELTWTKFKAWSAINVLGPVLKGAREYAEIAEKAGPLTTAWARFFDSLTTAAGETGPRMAALRREVDGLNPPLLENKMHVNDLITGYDGLAPKIASTAGETKRLADEAKRLHDERFNPAETLSGFEEATRVAAQKQIDIDNEIAAENKKRDALMAAHNEKMAAGAGWMKQATEIARVNKQAADFEKSLIEEQTKLDASNEELVKSFTDTGKAAAEGNELATTTANQTTQAYVGVQQQIELTSDAVDAWIKLMQYTAAANAILNQNSLFTSRSQLENIARMGSAFTGVTPIPGFAGGVTNFEGGLARVHEGELLTNLPRGTSVIPRGAAAGGVNMSNVFNLVDSESNLARKVSEMIMRTIRAGTQLSTA